MPTTGDRNDPQIAFCFDITIERQSLGGFSECSGIQWETETQDYLEGGQNSFVWKFPTRTKQSNLSLKRGIVGRMLWDWYWQVVQGRISLRTAGIVMHDPTRKSVVSAWEFYEVFPCKWIGPQLNAGQNSVAVETLELCYRQALQVR